MEPKRELTSVDLAALVCELSTYQGAVLDKAYLYGDDLVRLKLRDFDRGRVELLLEVGDVKRAHAAVPEHVPSAPGRPPDFAKMLRNRLSGANLVGVEQFGFDRILSFDFEREDANTTIVAELFGQGNVVVLDENRTVIDCLDTVRLKSRTVAPGATYEFPSSRVNPLALSWEAFVARMDDSDTDVVRTLATQLNFGGLYAEEICTRAGVEKALDIADADEDDYEPLFEAIEGLKSDLETGNFDPRVYEEREEPRSSDGASGEPRADGTRVDVTPFALEEHADLDFETFETFNAALDDYFLALEDTEDEEATSERPDFEEQIAKQERIIEQQRGAIEGFEEQAESERQRAELLYANYGLVDEILSTVQSARAENVPWDDIQERFEEGAERGIEAAEAVEGINAAEGTVTVAVDDESIELDASTGVEKNANRLYNEAKRIEEKAEGARAAIENTRAELDAAKERRDAWEAGPVEGGREGEGESEDESEEFEDVDWLARSSIPVRERSEWYDRFRWFHTSDGYLVIGGRNADQNEELVQKYLDRGDKFFHAQAHGGPVTILKATGPSEPAKDIEFAEETLRQAAQFAISYSSVWKDKHFSGDAYMVDPDQVSKTPESGEYLEKGGFAIRGDRTYFEDVAVGVAVGITCEGTTRVIGGPPAAIREHAETSVTLEPGQYVQNDMAKRVYRVFRERFTDTTFVRKVASPDKIQEFLAPGGSRIVDE